MRSVKLARIGVEMLPAPRTGGLYKIKCEHQGRFCRGLSVPFTVNVHGEPCFPGRERAVFFSFRVAQILKGRSDLWTGRAYLFPGWHPLVSRLGLVLPLSGKRP